mmetsp:Transcript_43665/g.139120  ORF Transcript_43665/g.139120 Transcript_43665/m.139120 type:complete len:100 (-) Transcript_43665:44-343(-)
MAASTVVARAPLPRNTPLWAGVPTMMHVTPVIGRGSPTVARAFGPADAWEGARSIPEIKWPSASEGAALQVALLSCRVHSQSGIILAFTAHPKEGRVLT